VVTVVINLSFSLIFLQIHVTYKRESYNRLSSASLLIVSATIWTVLTKKTPRDCIERIFFWFIFLFPFLIFILLFTPSISIYLTVSLFTYLSFTQHWSNSNEPSASVSSPIPISGSIPRPISFSQSGMSRTLQYSRWGLWFSMQCRCTYDG